MFTSDDPITAARAMALFTSTLATGCQPSKPVVADVIKTAVRVHGGCRGCAVEVAGEYGEHPETAVARMRWARRVTDQLYPTRAATSNRPERNPLPPVSLTPSEELS